tara:strand:+ start:4664 stop:5785 length:1122 start_codon:yes stop_codon:yes gene_type:complete
LRTAIIHDWFLSKGGAEQVFRQIYECFPDADVYSLFYNLPPDLEREIVNNKPINVTFLQRIPFAKQYHRYFFPLYKKAIESIDLSQYDLVISSSHAVAKGVKITNGQTHLCYCHTPVRYAWDLKKEYLSHLSSGGLKKIANWQLEKLRLWDLKSSERVTSFAANSNYVSKRIKKNYNRVAKVVYPPIDTGFFTPNGTTVEQRSQYIIISRLVPYKRIDVLIKAFKRLPHLKLKIVGTGPELQRLKELASPNIEFMGFVDNTLLRKELRKSRALLLAANEDFGITSLEAQSCGIPVIALKKGGYLETVVDGETGLFFERQDEEAIISTIREFEENRLHFVPEKARENAMRFSTERFREEFLAFVNDAINKNSCS